MQFCLDSGLIELEVRAMNPLPITYNKRDLLTSMGRRALLGTITTKDHEKRIARDMKGFGMSHYGMWRFGTRYLPKIIHPDEQIGGVVYGFGKEGSVMLVATDRRVIFLDKKPLFVNEDEITYDVVGGVSFGHAGPASTVTLHTRLRDYKIKTFNQKCALGFVNFVEARCLEHSHDPNRFYF